MNRRSFLRNSALALFGFTVLPPAETYQRVWRAERKSTIYWQLRECTEIDSRFCCVMTPPLDIFEVFDKVLAIRKASPQPEVMEVIYA